MFSFSIPAKTYPFRITFNSDAFEVGAAAMDEGTGQGAGFKLLYFQTSC